MSKKSECFTCSKFFSCIDSIVIFTYVAYLVVYCAVMKNVPKRLKAATQKVEVTELSWRTTDTRPSPDLYTEMPRDAREVCFGKLLGC